MRTTWVRTTALAGLLLSALPAAFAQDKPTPVTGKLPSKALCLVCLQQGESDEEKPAGAVRYKNNTYYFCSKKEVTEFLKDPDALLPLPIPRAAPAFSLKSVSGATTRFSDLKGRALLVDFWATWCAPCIAAMPDLQKLHARYRDKGFAVIGVSIDEEGAKKVGPFLAKRRSITYPILLDTGDVWQQWGVKAVPAMMLVDRNGQIVRQWTGKVDRKEVEKAVATLLEE